MHLRVLVNGTVEMVDKWKRDLAAFGLPYKHKTPEGKIKTGVLQMGVRTVELIDLVFPEDQLDTVLQMVKPTVSTYWTLDGKKQRHPWLERLLKWGSKAMKLTPIPEYKPMPHWFDKPFVTVHGIGIQQDEYDKDGIENI